MTLLDDPIFHTFKVGNHELPGIWRYILPDDFSWIQLPEERLATCDNCPKVTTLEYEANYKCCTYFPQIPNFMLGLALKDPGTRHHVEELIAKGYALPEGTQMTPKQLIHVINEYTNDNFGKSASILCPLMKNAKAGCPIYPFRNSTCSTFFCTHDHGDAGSDYWDRVQGLVGQIEVSLFQWAMTQVGMDSMAYLERLDSLADRVEELTDPATGAWSKATRKYLFGQWFGRECEFFEKCAEEAMTHRDELYEIACRQPVSMAFVFERAVQDKLPKGYESEMSPIPENPGEAVYVGDFWYKLQVATRRLWDLPYNENSVILSDEVTIGKNPKNDFLSRMHFDKPNVVVWTSKTGEDEKVELFLTETETSALLLFEKAQVIGEQLLDTPQMSALRNAKSFLAQSMRRKILVVNK